MDAVDDDWADHDDGFVHLVPGWDVPWDEERYW